MKLLRLSFRENPLECAVSLLESGGFDPLGTLVVTPTQRFKSYLASAMLERAGGRDLLCPSLITSGELADAIVSSLGFPLASEMERLSLLFEACARAPGVETLFSGGFLPGSLAGSRPKLTAFRETAWRVLRAFDELNREEVDFKAVEQAGRAEKTYGDFVRHLKIFGDLYETYAMLQEKAGVYDKSFLIGRVGSREIGSAFSGYGAVLLISPVSLTRFERRVFDLIREKLFVIYQDTEEYDFSSVLSFGGMGSGGDGDAGQRRSAGWSGEGGGGKGQDLDPGRSVIPVENPSRVTQLMAVLSIIEREIGEGTLPHEIAVLNIDPLFCEMLRESLSSLGAESNISGGLSLKKSPLYGFLNLAGSFFRSGLDSRLFLEILDHPVFLRLAALPGRSDEREKAKKAIVERRLFRMRHLSASPIPRTGDSAKTFSLIEALCGAKTFPALTSMLDALFGRLSGVIPRAPPAPGGVLEFQAAKEVILNTAIELEDCGIEVEETPFEIFLEYLRAKNYPIPGSHLSGVQIIGLLESRGLCFRTVVVPSFNEGFFPSRTGGDLLLSLELRKALHLPTTLDREDLELYYLKRILESSRRAYLLSIADASGEIEIPSRYRSLFLEGAAGATGADRSATSIVTGMDYLLPMRRERLTDYQPPSLDPALASPVREFSRLDVDTIKKCETKYFISKILKIEPEELLERGIEPDVVGLRVHALFREIYAAFDPDGGTAAVDELPDALSRLFDAHFPEGLFDTKEEVLFRRLLRDNLARVLERDMERFRSGYRVCREFMETPFTARIGSPDAYLLNGRIDRIDRTPGGGYLIVDYKTGRLPEKSDHTEKNGFMEVQLGFYGLLFRKTFPERRIEGLGYIDVGESRDLVIIVSREEIDSYLGAFEAHLSAFLRGFNGKERLSLTEDPGNCVYCPYPTVCRVNES